MHWLSHQWFGYWWPSDKGNGPENIQWSLIAAAVVAIFVPAVRAFFKRHFESVHAKMDEVHRMAAHIIEHHPDIPPLPPKEES